MSQATSIEWCDVTWNPTHGCSKVSPGCAHCYAETLSLRYRHTREPWTPANAAENVLLKPHKLREPFSNSKTWRGLGAAAAAAGKSDGKLVFVNSMSDLFHEQVPDSFIDRVFAVMALNPQHTFQVLTKQPERMRRYFETPRRITARPTLGDSRVVRVGSAANRIAAQRRIEASYREWPLPNVWLGVSIENRRFVHRADLLRETPAAVRFISAEPLLGPLVFDAPLSWRDDPNWSDIPKGGGYRGPELDLTGIDWLIVGGESGPSHRRMDSQWARDLRDACQVLGGTAFFMKQPGARHPGGALEDLPEDLRVREFPAVAEVAA